MTAENCGLESRRRCFLLFDDIYEALLLILQVEMTILTLISSKDVD